MIVNIPPSPSDNPVFLTALNGMLANLVEGYHLDEVHFVRIDRWFDHKWLRFSGKGRVAFNGSFSIDTALDPIWRDKLTFPPFSPNRVLEQVSFQRVGNSYVRNEDPRQIHSSERGHSAQNLQNRVAIFTESGLFVWFSSDSGETDNASVMSYAVAKGSTVSWFASFRKKSGVWRLHRVKGIDEKYVQKWFPLGSVP